MKELILSILLILSLSSFTIKENYKKIPVVIIMSKVENNTIEYDEETLKEVVYERVAKFYHVSSKGKVTLYNPFSNGMINIPLDQTYHYDSRKTFGLKSLKKSTPFIDYKQFDKNNNQRIEKDELIILNIIETKDTYEEPIAANIKTTDFYLQDLKIESFVQLGVREVFSNRESLLTPSTVAHEIGHHFGLPDLYDTDYSSKGLGPMSLMSEIHSDTPINFDPWSRVFLGYDDPQLLNTEGQHKIDKEKIYLVETSKNWIYYLIESRNFQGPDASLHEVMPFDGIYIYKINEKVINQKIFDNGVNRDENNMGIEFLGSTVKDLNEDIYLKGIDSKTLLIKKNN